MIGISVIFFDWLVKQWCSIQIFPLEISGSKTLRIWHNICGCNIHWQKKETKHPITATLKTSWRQTDTDPAVWLTNKSKKCLVRIWGRAHLNLLLDSVMCTWQGACENRPIESPALHHCRFSEYGCNAAEFGKKTLIVACKTCVGVYLPCIMNKGSPKLLIFIGFVPRRLNVKQLCKSWCTESAPITNKPAPMYHLLFLIDELMKKLEVENIGEICLIVALLRHTQQKTKLLQTFLYTFFILLWTKFNQYSVMLTQNIKIH